MQACTFWAGFRNTSAISRHFAQQLQPESKSHHYPLTASNRRNAERLRLGYTGYKSREIWRATRRLADALKNR
jgi:hypothetical protein